MRAAFPLAILLCLPLVVPSAAADILPAGGFPVPVSDAAAAWVGSSGFVLGGTEFDPVYGIQETTKIWRYHAPSASLTHCGNLPTSARFAAAASDGSQVYLFGGKPQYGPESAAILRIDPGSCAWTQVASMPQARSFLAAAWAPSRGAAYVVGGVAQTSILEFRPPSTVTTVGSLPHLLQGASVAWDPATARLYIFGGGSYGGEKGDILAFDPATGNVIDTGHDLPTPRSGTSAAWIGSSAYVFGGERSGPGLFSQVVRFSPATGATVVDTLPTPLAYSAAATNATAGWIFGGRSASNQGSSVVTISKFIPKVPPSAPTSLQATAGPAGRILLSWDPPVEMGTGSLLRYEVWYGASGEAASVRANAGLARSYEHAWLPDVSWATTGGVFAYRVRAVTTAGEGPWSTEARCVVANSMLPLVGTCRGTAPDPAPYGSPLYDPLPSGADRGEISVGEVRAWRTRAVTDTPSASSSQGTTGLRVGSVSFTADERVGRGPTGYEARAEVWARQEITYALPTGVGVWISTDCGPAPFEVACRPLPLWLP